MDENNGPVVITIRSVSLSEVYPIRQQILRPTQTIAEMVWEGDELPLAQHFGAFVEDRIVGILTMLPVDRDKIGSITEWQLRGMATLPSVRGRGAGSLLLQSAIEAAAAHGVKSLWCNARESAASFYSERGFTSFGVRFTIPHAGPHIPMAVSLA